jgi:hypothetical protein
MKERHYSPDGRKKPLIRFHSLSAYEEQVASLLPSLYDTFRNSTNLWCNEHEEESPAQPMFIFIQKE